MQQFVTIRLAGAAIRARTHAGREHRARAPGFEPSRYASNRRWARAAAQRSGARRRRLRGPCTLRRDSCAARAHAAAEACSIRCITAQGSPQ